MSFLPTRASIRALNMLAGKPLPIWDVCEGCGKVIQLKVLKQARDKAEQAGIMPLLNAWFEHNAETDTIYFKYGRRIK